MMACRCSADSANISVMSLSDKDRIDDVEKVLQLMMNELGDAQFNESIVDADTAPYDSIRQTTWKELLDRILIDDLGWKRYRLTKYGCLKGVELLKLTEDPVLA